MSAVRETVASVPRPDVVAAATPSRPRSRRRRSGRAPLVAVVLLVAAMAAVAGVLVATLEGGDGRSEVKAADALAARLPAAPASALEVGEPVALSRTGRGTATWAQVLRPATVRMAAAPDAPSIGRLGTRTPDGTDEIVQVLARTRDEAGRLWARVALPGRRTARRAGSRARPPARCAPPASTSS